VSIVPVNPPGPSFVAFAQGVQAGPWLIISGQVPTKAGELVSADPVFQARQCFENIAAVLAEAGATFSDVVKLTCFLTDPAAYPAYSQIKQEVLGTNTPSGTAVIVAGLLVPGALMEVEALVYSERLLLNGGRAGEEA
jgi:2-iminobutanoate/2-iminopropanoate deaminase